MTAPDAVFTARVPHIGTLGLAPVIAGRDADLLHGWLADDRAAFWGMTAATPDDVYREYHGYENSTRHRALLGLHDGAPAFLTEHYAPDSDPVGAVYDVLPGDVGLHFLAAPPAVPISGFTTAALAVSVAYLFSDCSRERVVVEPDVRNTKILAVNARVGFRPDRDVDLPDKRARLSFCTRGDFHTHVAVPFHAREGR